MIPLTAIFELIRRRKKYTKNSVCAALDISTEQLKKILQTENMPDKFIDPWAKVLDIYALDFTPLHQYNERQKIYRKLEEIATDKTTLAIATNLLFFDGRFDLTEIANKMTAKTVNLLYIPCQEVAEAIRLIRTKEETNLDWE